MDEYLFMGSELRLALEAQAQKMREAVEAEPEENLKQADRSNGRQRWPITSPSLVRS